MSINRCKQAISLLLAPIMIFALAQTCVAGTWTQGPGDLGRVGTRENMVIIENVGLEISKRIYWGMPLIPFDIGFDGGGIALVQDKLYCLLGTTEFWSFDKVTKTWTRLRDFPVDATYGTSLEWAGGGYLYAFSGRDFEFYRYNITDDYWEIITSPPVDVNSGSNLVWDGKEEIYAIIKGSDDSYVFKYNTKYDLWSFITSAISEVKGGSGLVYVDGWIYFTVGGGSKAFYKVNVSTGEVISLTSLPYPVTLGGSLVYDNKGNIYAALGKGAPTTFLKYNLSYNAWSVMSDIPRPAASSYYSGRHMVADNDYIYLVYEGDRSILKYNLATQKWEMTVPHVPTTEFYGSTIVETDNEIYGLFGTSMGWASDYLFSNFYNTTSVRENVSITRAAGDRAEVRLSFMWDNVATPPDSTPIYQVVWTGEDEIYSENMTHLLAYCVTTNSWHVVTELPVTTFRSRRNLIFDGENYIYLMGGVYPTENLYRYNIQTKSWDILAGAGVAIYAMELFENKIYGWSKDENIYVYDLHNNVWSLAYSGAPHPTTVTTDMLRVGKLIYMLRGDENGGNFHVFNPIDNTVTRLANVYSSVGKGGALAWLGDDYIYATVGESGRDNAFGNSLWMYSISANRWDTVYTMPAKVYNGGSITIGMDDLNKIYLFATPGNSPVLWKIDPQRMSPSGYILSSEVDTKPLPVTYEKIAWVASEPDNTDVRLQISSTGQSGPYLGPDGTTSTYYTTPYSQIYSGHSDETNFSYKLQLTTTNPLYTPVVSSVTVTWGPAAKLYKYSPGDPNWTFVCYPPVNLKLDGVSMVYGGRGEIYILGGGLVYAENRYYFYKYNTGNGTWTRLSDTPYRQGDGAALTYVTIGAKEYIYAFMGGNEYDPSQGKKFLRYDISGGFWEDMAELPYGVDDGGSLAWDGNNYIYAFNGAYEGTLTSKMFFRYDISRNMWEQLDNYPDYVDDGGSLKWDGGNYLYALSGSQAEEEQPDPSSSFWRYNLATGTWERLENLPGGIGLYTGNRLAILNTNTIYVFRGYETQDFWEAVVRFDDSARYTSTIKNAGSIVRWTTVSYDITIPDNCSATVEIRTSNDRMNWSAWKVVGTDINTLSQFLQYRVTLYSNPSKTATPRFKSITFHFETVKSGTPIALYPIAEARLNDNTPLFIWSPTPYTIQYSLQYSQDNSFTTSIIAPTSEIQYVPDEPLQDGVWYWRVRARNINEEYEEWSDTLKFVIDTIPPPIPDLQTIDKAVFCRSEVTLMWLPVDDNSGAVYEVQVSSDETFTAPITVTTARLSKTISDLADNTYRWRVRAIDLAGNSGPWSQTRLFIVNTAPPDIITPDMAVLREKEIKISWQSVPGITTYKVQISSSSDFTTIILEEDVSGNVFSTDDLRPGIYYWRVAAKGADGKYGAFSSAMSLTVTPAARVVTPRDTDLVIILFVVIMSITAAVMVVKMKKLHLKVQVKSEKAAESVEDVTSIGEVVVANVDTQERLDDTALALGQDMDLTTLKYLFDLPS